ncbi:MAG: hypothetical protein LBJ60_01720, partial [Tannerellaceae bacterium]|nr:hypothetical protein [Tannerellaceae bacterium]
LFTNQLPHILTNRCIRDPYVQWCERLTLPDNTGRAVYSITYIYMYGPVFGLSGRAFLWAARSDDCARD